MTLLKNDDGTFTVLSNIFSIVTQGDTLEEAIQNGQEALVCHIEGLTPGDDEFELVGDGRITKRTPEGVLNFEET